MSAIRLLGLFVTAFCLTVTAVIAQPGAAPGVKLPPQIKPGMPPGPMPKPGDPPKGKNPPNGNPKTPPGTPGLPPIIIAPGGGGTSPERKKDETKWPKDVNGKTVEVVVKEMRTHSDPGVREAAIRTLPLFGPRGREFGGTELVEAMTRDPDWNVRIAALSVAPTVLFWHLVLAEGVPDVPLHNGLNAMMNMLASEHMHVRFEAIAAVTNVGPYIRGATSGKVIVTLTSRSREASSWHMRRAAVTALGSVGQGLQRSEEPDDLEPPDPAAVTTLLDVAKGDNCAAVRLAAVNSLIRLGTVNPAQQKKWRSDLDVALGRERDKSVQLWLRTCILKNDPKGVEGNDAHLNAIALVLQAPEPAGRLEACTALGLLGDDAKSKLQDLLNLIQNPKEEAAIIRAGIAAVAEMKSQAKIILPIVDQIKANHPNADVKAVAAEASDILSGRKKN